MDRITAGFDQLTRFWLESAPARGVVARLDESVMRALRDHEYPVAVRSVLKQMAAASMLLASNLKQPATVVLQAQGDGDVPLLCVEATQALTFRAYANVRENAKIADDATLAQMVDRADAGRSSANTGRLLTNVGRFILTIDPDVGQMYQGIVAMEYPTVAENLQSYLTNSQQTDTRVWLREDGDAIEACMLERLPDHGSNEDTKAWDNVVAAMSATFAQPFMPFPYAEWLNFTFASEDVRVHPAQRVKFACPCSRDRVLNALKLVGEDELMPIVEANGQVDTQCEFCGQQYAIDRATVLALFAEKNPNAVPGTRTLQ
jgi:molecular chaperone Hsp33